ncbi:MAG TPA: ABC transporter ATP-binding protein [bacterium]|nr:ABC transporter ATP-binding protein [bacterium]
MLIKLEKIKKDYYSKDKKVITPALRGVDLEIKKGEFLAIMGPSGSGKSTLLYILGLLDRPTSGKYFLEGEDVLKFSDEKLAFLRNKKFGFVFQSFHLLPKISVLENVLLPAYYNQEVPLKKAKEKALFLLEKVGLKEKISSKPNELSGGEQQRVAIARALINEPEIIIADEPTGNLDSLSGKKVMEIFSKIHQEGKTIILVTHEEDIASYAQRKVYLKDGKIIS